MTTTSPPLAPARDATETLTRLSALIDSLRQPEDLTPERVSQFTGIAMPRVDWPSRNQARIGSQVLTASWSYEYIWKLNDTTRLPDLGFGFDQLQEEVNRPAMTDICQFDVAQFHDALLRMGYRHIGSTRRESPARQYQRELVVIELAFVGESGESLETIGHDCVKRVSVHFLEKYVDLGALK